MTLSVYKIRDSSVLACLNLGKSYFFFFCLISGLLIKEWLFLHV